VWPKPVADFISHDGPGLGIKKIAILYATNEFTGTQANAFRKFVKDSGAPIEIVYDQGVPTETTNYTVIINNIANANPDAVIHFGYAPNDIAFLRNVQDVGSKFKMLFCIYAGLETELLERTSAPRDLSTSSLTCRRRNWNTKSISAWTWRAIRRPGKKPIPMARSSFGFNAGGRPTPPGL